jgi:hypothetical protein
VIFKSPAVVGRTSVLVFASAAFTIKAVQIKANVKDRIMCASSIPDVVFRF